jgi:hypothetical protein
MLDVICAINNHVRLPHLGGEMFDSAWPDGQPESGKAACIHNHLNLNFTLWAPA